MRLVLLGNAGSGKSTLAKKLAGDGVVARLCLDDIAWDTGVRRKTFEESIVLLDDFLRRHRSWIVEGCYGDLAEAALPACEELIFLNPGIEACVAHCRNRPWEPDKFGTREEQEQSLDQLIEWVKAYETRTDEYGLARHRQIYESFAGVKREYRRAEDYSGA